MLLRRLRRVRLRLVERLATAVRRIQDSNILFRMPRYRLVLHRMLGNRNVDENLEEVRNDGTSRLPRNCSGAIYGSLPHSPVDMCTVVSQGNLYTVEAP
jgi:hypothetical protein